MQVVSYVVACSSARSSQSVSTTDSSSGYHYRIGRAMNAHGNVGNRHKGWESGYGRSIASFPLAAETSCWRIWDGKGVNGSGALSSTYSASCVGLLRASVTTTIMVASLDEWPAIRPFSLSLEGKKGRWAFFIHSLKGGRSFQARVPSVFAPSYVSRGS